MGRVRVLEVLLLVVLVLGMFPCACAFASWQENGNPICTAADQQSDQVITSDGSGGAIIAWSDDRSGYSDVYARRVDASGNVLWTVDGVAICTLAGHQYNPGITSDGSGGAIIAWRDQRNGGFNPDDIYAQRVDGLGNVMWVANGVAICTAPNTQGPPQLISDGSGGAIITWVDGRAVRGDIYAQRVNASGNVLWIANGVGVCTNDSIQTWPQIASDGAGGL